MRKSNCLIWAILLYTRRRKKGKEGYLSFRGSRLARIGFHALYTEKRPYGYRMVSYSPVDKVVLKSVLQKPVFEGYVKWGDD